MPPPRNNLLNPKQETGAQVAEELPAAKAEPIFDLAGYSIRSLKFRENAMICGGSHAGVSEPTFRLVEDKTWRGFYILKTGETVAFVPMENIASVVYSRKGI